jgi:sulfatase modifying factor 1
MANGMVAAILVSLLTVAVAFAAGRDRIGQDGAPMVLVPAGEFTMGGQDVADEQPVHRVHLDAFYMDTFEVTVTRYGKFRATTKRSPPRHWDEINLARDGARPIIGVSWQSADAYCRWAGKRLPTEAEWEKAARGADARPYPWGNGEPTNQHGNFGRSWTGYETLDPVGSHPLGESPYGIEDLAGNVWEWVADWYYRDYYRSSPPRNPPGPAEGEEKVFRGGGWNHEALLARSSLRNRDEPDTQINSIGFRCAMDAK